MNLKGFFIALMVILVTTVAYAGMEDRASLVELIPNGRLAGNSILLPDIAAPNGTPPTNKVWIYSKAAGSTSAVYVENDAGTVTALGTTVPKTITEIATNTTLTAAQSGGTFTNEGASAGLILNLPPASAGLTYTFINTASGGPYTLNVNPDDADIIYNPAALDAGDSIESSNPMESITLQAIDGTDWSVISTNLATAWTDAS